MYKKKLPKIEFNIIISYRIGAHNSNLYDTDRNGNKKYYKIIADRPVYDGCEYRCFKKVLNSPQKVDEMIKDFVDIYSDDDYKVGLQSFKSKKFKSIKKGCDIKKYGNYTLTSPDSRNPTLQVDFRF